MKNIKIFLLSAFLLGSLSCGKDFGDINVDPNNPQVVPPETLITACEKTLADYLSIYSLIPAELLAQTWASNNYTEFSRYIIDGGYSNAWFTQLYAGALQDLADIQTVVSEHPGLDAAADKNKIAIAKTLQAYTFQVMTDAFGPVPYTDALRGAAGRAPKYDSQKDIYLGLLRDLHAAIDLMDVSAGSFGSADIIYGGDVAKWKKFAHALLLRVAMRMSDVPDMAAMAQAEVENAAANAFSDNDDNASFKFLGGAPNNLPLNQQRIERGDADLGLSDILIDKTLKPLNDPRLPTFADEREAGGGYFGRPYGQDSGNAASEEPKLYSQPSGAAVVRAGRSDFKSTDVLRPDANACFMGYAEVCFILSEARERGWNVGSTAADWYEKGITASMREYGIEDQTTIDAYLAQPGVAYATAPGDWKQKIGVQKWLALFMQGLQGWIEWRRLDFDKLELPEDGAVGDVGSKVAPVRLIYPSSEQGLNSVNYNAAVGLLGGPDKLSTRVWWDVQ